MAHRFLLSRSAAGDLAGAVETVELRGRLLRLHDHTRGRAGGRPGQLLHHILLLPNRGTEQPKDAAYDRIRNTLEIERANLLNGL